MYGLWICFVVMLFCYITLLYIIATFTISSTRAQLSLNNERPFKLNIVQGGRGSVEMADKKANLPS